MANEPSVYPVGTYVKFINGKEENEIDEGLAVGMICEINLDANGASYMIVWWDGNTRNEVWCTELEFVPASLSTEKAKIGFK
jgi:hypothetical protein